jgi:hypothetical protein
MKARFAALAIAIAAAVPHQAHAVRYIGAGAETCGFWTEVRRYPGNPNDGSIKQWVLGFISGTALGGFGLDPKWGFDPLEGVDAYAVWAWVDNYCRAHPLEIIANAAKAFILEHPK